MRERFGRLGAELRSRARDQAHWLIRDHGADAEALIAEKLARPGLSPADRYRYSCTARELRALRAGERGRASGTALVPWTPAIFSIAALARFVSLRIGGHSARRRTDRG